MTTDRELLELAAKAAGIEHGIFFDAWPEDGLPTAYARIAKHRRWSPLSDDGDALRLAVALDIAIFPPRDSAGDFAIASLPEEGDHSENWIQEFVQDGNKPAATRRAIVRAAAEIGRSLAGQEQQGQEGEGRE